MLKSTRLFSKCVYLAVNCAIKVSIFIPFIKYKKPSRLMGR